MPRREFTDAKGRHLIEEYGWLGSPTDKRRRFVRRVTWKRTDHKDLSVVTDLTNRQPGQDAAAPESILAADLIDLYLIRWQIETVFQDVTVVFGLRKLIGSTPEATAFQAAFCMVVYNAIMVVKSYLAAVQPKPMSVDDVSNTMLFTSIRKELTTIAVLVPAASLAELVVPPKTAKAARNVSARTLDRFVGEGLEESTQQESATLHRQAKRLGSPYVGLSRIAETSTRPKGRRRSRISCAQRRPRPPAPSTTSTESPTISHVHPIRWLTMNKHIPWRRWIFVAVLVLGAGRAAGQEATKNTKFPQQIMLIRHAEKTGKKGDAQLSETGTERAKMLPQLFTKSDKAPAPFPTPDFLFAAHDSQDSERPRVTVLPLATHLKMPIDDNYYSSIKPGKKGAADLRDELFKSPKYAGKTILISWRHSKLPDLAKTLKADTAPTTWGDDVYDRVWQITYDDLGKATFVDRPQRLMPKDSAK